MVRFTNNDNHNNNNLAVDIPPDGPVHYFLIELQLGMLVFVEGGKPEDPEKNRSEQGRQPRNF